MKTIQIRLKSEVLVCTFNFGDLLCVGSANKQLSSRIKLKSTCSTGIRPAPAKATRHPWFKSKSILNLWGMMTSSLCFARLISIKPDDSKYEPDWHIAARFQRPFRTSGSIIIKNCEAKSRLWPVPTLTSWRLFPVCPATAPIVVVFFPIPSCPFEFDPQQTTRPSSRITQTLAPPRASDEALCPTSIADPKKEKRSRYIQKLQ